MRDKVKIVGHLRQLAEDLDDLQQKEDWDLNDLCEYGWEEVNGHIAHLLRAAANLISCRTINNNPQDPPAHLETAEKENLK